MIIITIIIIIMIINTNDHFHLGYSRETVWGPLSEPTHPKPPAAILGIQVYLDILTQIALLGIGQVGHFHSTWQVTNQTENMIYSHMMEARDRWFCLFFYQHWFQVVLCNYNHHRWHCCLIIFFLRFFCEKPPWWLNKCIYAIFTCLLLSPLYRVCIVICLSIVILKLKKFSDASIF